MNRLDGAQIDTLILRSLLYVPTSSERFVSKAHERGADAIILDLEDSVASSEKEKARATLADAVPAVSRNGAKAFVRINSEPELMFADAEAACRAGSFGIFVPKSRRAADLVRLAEHLEKIECGMLNPSKTLLVPMIEDAGAVLDARSLAGASSRTLGLITGGEDLATAMGAQPSPEMLRIPKILVHLAAKAAGVLSFGLLRSVAGYRDVEDIKRAAQEAREFGFDGASCVHPSAVPILNEAFAASPEEIDRAARLIAAYQLSVGAGHGACVFEGQMIDRPVVARSQALLAKWGGRQKSSQPV